MDTHLPAIGTRISHNSHLGTIRYVGPVDNTAGIWLGVDWDDLHRGKHDGSKDGKSYFSCRSGSAGSFIRPTANLLYGVSFLTALRSKYVEALHGSGTQETVTLGSSQGAIEVKAVSLDKIREKFARLDYLREVSLDGNNVVHGDPPGRILNTVPNIRGLDLSQNLLPSWEAVAQIAKELPMLQRLSLNRNRLQLPSNPEILEGSFPRLTEIQLNNTLMTWTEMKAVTTFMPQLKMIEIGYNRLARLANDTAPSTLISPSDPYAEILNLDSNFCSDWVHICASLREYKTLQRVVLAANLIETIPFPASGDSLPGIQHISLSDNRINSWSSVDALSYWFPSLKSLVMSGNPVANDKEIGKDARPFIIARIPSLVTLDGASITTRDRTDSELFYMSLIIKKGPVSEDKRREEHRRWVELCEKHGKPNEAQKQQAVQDKLSNHLIDLKLYPYSESMKQNGFTWDQYPQTVMHVLPTMTLRILRMKMCKTLKYDSRRTKLACWLRMGEALAELDVEHDLKDLDWLGLESGSQIIYKILQ